MSELGQLTSEALAPMMGTNPVVVRRTMAGLRDAGIVRSEKGHGGGWSLARPLEEVTFGDVYEALGKPALFSMGPRVDNPGCLVEQAVNRALAEAMGQAETVLLAQLRATPVGNLAAEFRRHMSRTARKGTGSHG